MNVEIGDSPQTATQAVHPSHSPSRWWPVGPCGPRRSGLPRSGPRQSGQAPHTVPADPIEETGQARTAVGFRSQNDAEYIHPLPDGQPCELLATCCMPSAC